MEIEGVDGLVGGLVRAPEAQEIRRDHPVAGGHEGGDHAPVEIAPGRLAVQAEPRFGRIARPGVDVLDDQPVGAAETSRGIRKVGQSGQMFGRCAQNVAQWCILPAMKPEPKKDDRAERLAAALRENLKRRKAQARTLQEKDKQSTPQSLRKRPAVEPAPPTV